MRFDGLNFTIYNRENTPELRDNTITALYETSDGLLIIGTAAEGIYSYDSGRFSQITKNLPENLKKISVLFEDRKKNLWIGTDNIGLVCQNNGCYTMYTTADGLPNNKIRSITQDSRGILWILTEFGLCQINLDANRPVNTIPIRSIPIAIIDIGEEMLIGSQSGIASIKISSDKPIFTEKYNIELSVKCMVEDRDYNLWVGTDGGGLIRILKDVITTYTAEDGLASNFIHSLFEDRQGNLWIGSLGEGLFQLKDTDFGVVSTKEGLSHDVIGDIIEDRFGNVWVGTKGGGVNRLKNNKVDFVLNIKNGLKSDVVYSLMEESAGAIWIGTDSGLYRYQKNSMTAYTTKEGLAHNQIFQIIEDKEGTIWVVTKDKINLLKNNRISEYIPPKELTQKNIQYIYKCSDGSFRFVIQNGGICSLEGNRTTFYDESTGLVQNEVESMYEDRVGVVYFGTRGGMSRIEKGKITNFTTQSGLLENQVRHIMEDRFGYLWLSGRLGIYRIARQEVDDYAAGLIDRIHPMTFDQSDGIEQPWCESGIVARDGKLWFTSYKGLVIIAPEKVGSHTSTPPRAIIEVMNVNGSPVDIYQKGEILTLPPGKKRIEFVYTAPSFYKPQKVKFHHRLIGYEKDWVEVGTNRSTFYTGLGPGRYTFEVAASNPQGIWSPESATLLFDIKPFFYQTIWFILAMAASILLLTVFTYKLRTRQLRNREKTLSSLVESRTQELRQSNAIIEAKNQQLEKQSEKLKEMDRIKSRFFANISHEFRTPLTLILGPLERRLFEAGDDHDLEELEMMLRNSRRLLSLINQLLDLAKLESGGMGLQASKQDIVAFTRGIAQSFDSLLVQQRLKLEIEAAEESILIYFDGEKIEKVICNLLTNAIKFTPSGGTITFILSRDTGSTESFPRGLMKLIVRDTGSGIPENQLPYIFNHFYQVEGIFSHLQAAKGSGIGLALVKELVVLHRGDIAVKSTPGEGTEFVVRLPLGTDHLKPEEMIQAIPGDVQAGTDNSISEAIDSGKQSSSASKETTAREEKDLILVVEDNPDVRLYIRKALAPMYCVEEAENGATGIDLARRLIPDLIVSDVMMPETDGYILCETLKKDIATSHIPIILLTARAAEENVVEGLETGADDYVTKPFNTRILLTRIKNLIRLRRDLQQNIQQELILQPEKIAVNSIDREFIKELKHSLEKNIADPEFGVDDLAQALFMSRATLNRKIKAISGESTNRFIQSFRLKRAAQLLEEHFGNVTEVAFAVGFSSSAYFTKCFKEQFNQLPNQYGSSPLDL